VTDVEYFKKHLDNHYVVTHNGTGFRIINKFNGDYQTKYLDGTDVMLEIKQTLGFVPKDVIKIIGKWYNNYKEELSKEFLKYIEGYRVELSAVGWDVIDPDGNMANVDKIIKDLSEYYDTDKLIEQFFNEWKIDKVIETSTKMIENN